MENAIHREKNKSRITAPIIQDPTEMIHHMTPTMPMSAGKMADTEKHSKTRRFQSQDQLPHRPGDQSKGSSSGDRGGSSADGEGPHSESGAGDQDSNGDPSEGARQCKGLQVGVSSPACDISGAEASDDATAAALNAEQLLFLERQLEVLCLQCERAVKVKGWSVT